VFVGTGIGGCALVVGEFVDCAPTAAAAAAHASAKIFDESISLFSSNVVKLLAIVMKTFVVYIDDGLNIIGYEKENNTSH
ncbi:hypothetical protein DERF_010381, partial [Dermatophagoides farinae]